MNSESSNQELSSVDPAIATDLRYLHAEIGRLRAAIVDMGSLVRLVAAQPGRGRRQHLASKDIQDLVSAWKAEFGHTIVPREAETLLARLLWFEMNTASEVPFDADAFLAGIAGASVVDGDAPFICGPDADIVVDALAECGLLVGGGQRFTVHPDDRTAGPRLGRKDLDATPHIIIGDRITSAVAMFYGDGLAGRLERFESDLPDTVIIASTDHREDGPRTSAANRLSTRFRVAIDTQGVLVLRRIDSEPETD